MTDNHHADARVESARLRRMMGTALTTDSFGETRSDKPLCHSTCESSLVDTYTDGWVHWQTPEGMLTLQQVKIELTYVFTLVWVTYTTRNSG